jgi:myo-inositol-hexaphosphate 3-phosphohydrolase
MKLFFPCLLVASLAFGQVVPWTAETTSIASTQAGDPAFVFVPTDVDAGVSLIVGTDTAQTGLYVWGVTGALQQIIPLGLVSSADSRDDIVTAAISNGSLSAFQVGDAGIVRYSPSSISVATPNSVAMQNAHDGGYEVWVDTSSTTLVHFAFSRAGPFTLAWTLLPSVTLPQVPSGLAVDDRTGRVYVSISTMGIVAVEPDGTSRFVASIDAGQLGAVIGGIDLFPLADGGTLLFTGSPAAEQIVVHRVSNLQSTFVTQFQVGPPDGGSSRARLTRHVAIFPEPVPDFPRGVLLVQDGVLANYKLVSMVDVAQVVPDLNAVTTPDGGLDGGVDGGASLDGGTRPDGGSVGVTGGPGGMPSGEPTPTPTCGCHGGPLAVLPALLLLWWIRRPRS